MKKLKYISLIVIMMFTCVLNVNAVTYATQEECIADVGGNTNLATVTNKTTVRSCVQNYCNTATMTYEYYGIRLAAAGGTCANGNRLPYQTITYGLNRTTKCTGRIDRVYTNMDVTYDCTRTTNGQAYQQTTKSQTTKKQNTTKKTTTPTQGTTKRTGETTTEKIGGNDTTSQSRVTSPEETTSSTTTTRAISSDASIRSITINNKFDLGYTPDRNEYSIKVPYSMDEFNVYVETNDSTASVDVSGHNDITSAGGVIEIRVTSSDLSNSTTVKINVSRYTKEEGDCSLAQLLIKDYNIDFSSSKEQYTIKLNNNDRSLTIEATPSNPSSIFTINGNEKLKNNSKVEILVEAVDGTTCTYVITTKKQSKLLLYLLIIVVVGVALFFAVKTLREYTTKGKNRYKYE